MDLVTMMNNLGYEHFEDLIADLVDDELNEIALSAGDVMSGADLARNRPEIHAVESEDGRACGVAIYPDMCNPPLVFYDSFQAEDGKFYLDSTYATAIDNPQVATMFSRALNSIDWSV